MTKDIAGFEGLYAISDDGNVLSLRTGRFLKPITMGSKYLYVHLCNGKKTRLKRIHRLVAEAFIPNPNNLPQVNHIDGNKRNCSASNLEWCSPKQNMLHAMNNGLFDPVGENNPSAKLTAEQVEQIRAEYVPKSKTHGTVALGRKYGVSNVMIGKIVNNKNWNFDADKSLHRAEGDI